MKNLGGKIIKFVRLSLGLSQHAIAEATDYSTTSICRWESGEYEPTFETVFNIAYHYAGFDMTECIDGAMKLLDVTPEGAKGVNDKGQYINNLGQIWYGEHLGWREPRLDSCRIVKRVGQ